MKLHVELQTYLEQYSPNGGHAFDYEMPDDATVGALVHALRIPEDVAAVLIVNGINADPSHPLHDGDTVIVIPPLAGGASVRRWPLWPAL
jgi:molybdopterin converting factor small subunit